MATRPTLMLPQAHVPFVRGIRRGRWYSAVKGRMTAALCNCHNMDVDVYLSSSL